MGRPTRDDLKTLGLTQEPQNEVIKALIAAAARLLNSGALQTAQGKQSQAILVAAAQGASPPVAKAIAGAGASSGLTIHFAVGVDPASLTPYSRSVLFDVMRVSGISSIRITSTFRTPQEQAKEMFDQIDRRGETAARQLYNATAEKVLDVYVSLKPTGVSDQSIISAMATEILRQLAINPNSFRHIADPKVLNTIDIAPSSIPIGKHQAFIQAVLSERRISNFFHPPIDEAFHIEIPQP